MRVPRFLDVSVPLAAGIPAYPGNPEFELQPVKRIADGGSSNVSRLVMGTHTGTHVDAPLHFFDGRPGVDELRARAADRPRARRRPAAARRHHARTISPPAGLREDLRVLLQDAELRAVERRRRLPAGLHLPDRGRRAGTSSTRASRSSASTTCRSSSSRRPGAPAHRALLAQRRHHHRRTQPLRRRRRACTRCTACRCASPAATARRRASS